MAKPLYLFGGEQRNENATTLVSPKANPNALSRVHRHYRRQRNRNRMGWITVLCLKFLPPQIYLGVVNPWIYILLIVETSTKLRYYMWLSISRSYRHDLNGKAQLFYALPTAILTPFLLWLFLYPLNLGLLGIFATGAIVGTIQLLPTELYFRKRLT